jgi:hypothetical protein
MYAAAQPDFDKVHAVLKPFFLSDKDGELSFVSRFCEFIAVQSDVLAEYSITFERGSIPSDRFDVIVSEIGRVISKNVKDSVIFEEGHLEIPFSCVAPFLIECRNKLFHNSNSGQKNFDIDRLHGATDLCRLLVSGGLHWLSLTYVEVIRNRAAHT